MAKTNNLFSTTTSANPAVWQSYTQSNTIPTTVGVGGVQPNSVNYPAAGSFVPVEGIVITIKDKVYRFSAGANEWHEVIDAEVSKTTEPPLIPVELDGRSMLIALKTYKQFLEDLDDLEKSHADAVSDIIFGLTESIEALEKLVSA